MRGMDTKFADLVRGIIPTIPGCTTVVVHTEDYNQHLRNVLGEELVRTRNVATMMSGCVGHFIRPDGKAVALFVRDWVPRGEARVGTVSVLKEPLR